MMNELVARNPFWKRELTRGLTLLRMGDIATWGQMFVVLLLILVMLGPHVAFTLFMAFFVLGLTWAVVSTAGSTFSNERAASALELSALVPMSPVRETLGRWLGAVSLAAPFWGLSILAVPVAALLAPSTARLSGFLLMWLFVGLWLAAVAAVSILCACLVQRQESVGTLIFGLCFLVPAVGVYLLPSGELAQVLPLSIGIVALLFQVVLEPEYRIGDIGHLVQYALLLWTLFTPLCLALATALVAARIPHLGLPSRRRAAAPRRVRRLAPWFRMPAGVGGDSPMYSAWLAAGRIDLWMVVAGGMVTLLTSVGLLSLFCVLGQGMANHYEVGDAITVGSMLACLGYLVLGCTFGSACYSHERQSVTWPLLVLSGLRPHQVVGGLFARCLHALAWTCIVPLPLWLLVAVYAPALSLLAVLPPVVLCVGILGGIASAASHRPQEPRPFVTSVLVALGAVFCVPFAIGLVCLLMGLLPTLTSPQAQVQSLLMVHGASALPGLGQLAVEGLLGFAALQWFEAKAIAKTQEIMG